MIRLLMVTVSLCLVSFAQAGPATDDFKLDLKGYDFSDYKPRECLAIETCLSLDEMTKRIITHNLETKGGAERVFMARHRVGIALGKIIPTINLNSALGFSVGDYTSAVSSLLGFAFPSNWYNWKGAKLQVEAQKQSYFALLANQRNSLENLSINILMSYERLKILRYYTKLVKRLIKRLFFQIERKNRKVSKEALGIVFNIKAKINIAKSQQKSTLMDMIAALRIALNWSDKEGPVNVSGFEKIPSLDNESVWLGKEFFAEVKFKSPELKNLHLLIRAATLNKKSVSFSFLHPGSSNSPFGLSYYYDIRLAKSKLNLINIEKEKVNRQLESVVAETINLQNTALAIYKKGLQARHSMLAPAESLVDNVYYLEEFFDLEKALRFFDYLIASDEVINSSRFVYLQALANKKRMLLKGPFYENLSSYLPEKAN